MSTRTADYGVDAPVVIRNLSIAGALLLALALAAALGALPRNVEWETSAGVRVRLPLVMAGLTAGLGFASGAAWIYLGSRFGKIRERDRLLDRIEWRGDERVLDVGCGRGLVLVGAARRLTTGSAVGVDLWQAEDLSGNRPDAPLANAALEGVAGRVTVQTADMRRLPFDDGAFDVVVSRAAIHNLYAAPDRAAAIAEIARVLKPGGRALIVDIRHVRDYARTFAAHGCPGARQLDSQLMAVLLAVGTFGRMRPNTLLARKAT